MTCNVSEERILGQILSRSPQKKPAFDLRLGAYRTPGEYISVVKITQFGWVVLGHAFNPSTQEEEAGESL